jgi:exonuclease III
MVLHGLVLIIHHPGLRAILRKMGPLHDLLKKFEADIVCVQETKMSYENLSSFDSVADYHSYWSFSTIRKVIAIRCMTHFKRGTAV